MLIKASFKDVSATFESAHDIISLIFGFILQCVLFFGSVPEYEQWFISISFDWFKLCFELGEVTKTSHLESFTYTGHQFSLNFSVIDSIYKLANQ